MNKLDKALAAFHAVRNRPPDTQAVSRLLFWSPLGGALELLSRDLSLALALNRRGCAPVFVLCDGSMSGCCLRSVDHGKDISQWGEACRTCSSYGERLLEAARMPYYKMSDFLDEPTKERLRTRAQELALDPKKASAAEPRCSYFALTSTLRYYKGEAKAELREEYPAVLSQYYYSALVVSQVAEAFLEQHPVDMMVVSNPQHVEFGPAHDRFISSGVPVTFWMNAFLANHVFAAQASIERGCDILAIDEGQWSELVRTGIGERQQRMLKGYLRALLRDRTKGLFALARKQAAADLPLSGSRPVWVMFCHVHWDMVFEPGKDYFDSVHDWVLKSVAAMIEIDDVDWIVRCHPGEMLDGTTFKTHELIRETFPELPGHVTVLHGRQVSSYDIMELAQGCVTIRSTAGLESLLMGKPAILGGSSYYGGKGFTHDAVSEQHYYELLGRAARLSQLSDQQRNMAEIFAHHVFIERQIPYAAYDMNRFEFIKPGDKGLGPGADAGVDVLCDGILHGERFTVRP